MFVIILFFCLSGILSTRRFYFYIITTQGSCSASGSLREMPDSNPRPLPQKATSEPLHILLLQLRRCQTLQGYLTNPLKSDVSWFTW